MKKYLARSIKSCLLMMVLMIILMTAEDYLLFGKSKKRTEKGFLGTI